MLALITSTNFFVSYADTLQVITPTSGQSKSSNYILDYGTYLNQRPNASSTKTKVVVDKSKIVSNDNNQIATIKEIDFITQEKPIVATSSVDKNLNTRNLIYLSLGLLLILIIIILSLRFIKILHKYD